MQVSQLRSLMSGCYDAEVNNAVFNSWLPSATVSDPPVPSSLWSVYYPSRLRAYVPGVGPYMHARTHTHHYSTFTLQICSITGKDYLKMIIFFL